MQGFILRKSQHSVMKAFISYASPDLKPFRISEMATRLENTEKIERVFYWDRDSTAQKSIVKYMEESITVSDVILIVCTEASNDSGPVQQETDMAVYLGKRIVPIFQDINDVRISLRPKRGVKYYKDDFDSFFKDLFMVITETLPEIPQEEEIVEFHGIPLVIAEYRAMKSLEEQLGIIIPPVESFCIKNKNYRKESQDHPLVKDKGSSFGFVAEQNHIIQFNFSRWRSNQEDQIPPIINYVPEGLSHLLFLRALDLSFQNISIIPSFIGNLSQLEYLNFIKNKIKKLPKNLAQLKKLKVFLVFQNQLVTGASAKGYFTTRFNFAILKLLLQNKCKLDREYKTSIKIDYKLHSVYHKDIYCVICGHSFNLEKKNYKVHNNKIYCPISPQHGILYAFKIKND